MSIGGFGGSSLGQTPNFSDLLAELDAEIAHERGVKDVQENIPKAENSETPESEASKTSNTPQLTPTTPPPDVPPEWEGRTREDVEAEFAVCDEPDRIVELTRARHAITGESLPLSYVRHHEGKTLILAYDPAGLHILCNSIQTAKVESGGPAAIDIETTALYPGGTHYKGKDGTPEVAPPGGKIRLIQLAAGDVLGVIDAFYVNPKPLLEIIERMPAAYVLEDSQ